MSNFVKHTGLRNVVVRLLFVCYLLILIKVILLKFPIPVILDILRYGENMPYSRANLIPFSTIQFYLAHRVSLQSAVRNLLGNVVAFLPLGIFLPLLLKKCYLWRTVFIALSISLLFELAQLQTGLGSFDVDDILLNVAGAVIGYAFSKMIRT